MSRASLLLAMSVLLTALGCGAPAARDATPAAAPTTPAGAPAAAPAALPEPDGGVAASFDVQEVAAGVYAAIRRDPPGMMFNGNSAFIINDEDVVVVDTTNTPASARALLAALRKLTNKPVRYVINTHWHDDHMMGNQVFQEAFPGVEIIGHASTLVDLPTVGAKNRQGLLDYAKEGIASLRKQIQENQSMAGGPLTEEERASHISDIALVEQYVAEAPGFRVVPPTLTVTDGLTLRRGSRTIEIRHLGRGHSGADLVVHLPNERLVISGDLVVWPVPLVGSTSYPAEYGPALERLLALRPAAIVPGHGPVLRDDSHVRTQVRLLKSIDEQTRAAVARGETLEQAQKSVNLEELRKEIAGESKLRRILFRMYVWSPGVEAAYGQASEQMGR